MSRKPTVGSRRLRTLEWVPLAGAFVWSVGLLIALPSAQVGVTTYADTTGPNAGVGPPPQSSTLLDENGSGVLLIIGVPLLMTILVALALWFRRSRRGAGPIAWTLTGLLTGFNLLGMLTIGLFVIPVTACVAFACLQRQTRPQSGGRDAAEAI